MAKIPQDVLDNLSQLQNQIWQTVSLTTSEACGQAVSFTGTPLTLAAKTSALYSEITAPMIVVQFAFSSMPDNVQVALLPQETVIALLGLVQGSTVTEIDENVVSDLRGPLEGIVQGLCLAIGNIRNEPMVATGLHVRYQIFNFPPNLQRSEEVVRSQLTLSADGVSGTILWLIDSDTAHFIVGQQMTEEEIAASAPITDASFGYAGSNGPIVPDDPGHLDILMDVPLEITVELGRVKMQVREVLELTNGSVVEIDRIAGEPIDVLVNGRIVAKGEVVVVEDNFGVRITEILNPMERANRVLEAA